MVANDKLEIRLTPESQLLISKIGKVGNFSLKETFKRIGVVYRRDVRAIFQRQQPRGEGLKWSPLSTAYAAWKAKNYPDAKGILRRTNRLFLSMTTDQHPENITDIKRFRASFGSSVPYGVYHDSTENPGRSNPPMRNFSIPGQSTINGMLKTIESAFIQSFKAHGVKVSRVFM